MCWLPWEFSAIPGPLRLLSNFTHCCWTFGLLPRSYFRVGWQNSHVPIQHVLGCIFNSPCLYWYISDSICIDVTALASCSIQFRWLRVIHDLVIYAYSRLALFLSPLYGQERYCPSKGGSELPRACREQLRGQNLQQSPALILLAMMLLYSCPISGIKGPSKTPLLCWHYSRHTVLTRWTCSINEIPRCLGGLEPYCLSNSS